jgi:hypothetical protein
MDEKQQHQERCSGLGTKCSFEAEALAAS